MKKGTPEQIAQKREEIINACEQLYRTMSFREITLKEIGGITSFSRPTIYNYFETKEEIFLALFKREYDRWNEQLTAVHDHNEQLTKAQLAEQIAQSLAERQQLLKLLGGRAARNEVSKPPVAPGMEIGLLLLGDRAAVLRRHRR